MTQRCKICEHGLFDDHRISDKIIPEDSGIYLLKYGKLTIGKSRLSYGKLTIGNGKLTIGKSRLS